MTTKHLVPASEIEHRINIRPKEVAAIYGIAESVIYRAVQSGQLPARKFGKIWLIRKEDVDPWVEQNSTPNDKDDAPVEDETQPAPHEDTVVVQSRRPYRIVPRRKREQGCRCDERKAS